MRLAWLFVAAACGRVGFDGRQAVNASGDGPPGSGDGGSGDASASGPPACGSTVLFTEAFTSSNTPQWTTTNSGGFTIAAGGGHLSFTFPASSGFASAALASVQVLDVSESCFLFELDAVPSSSQPASAYMMLSGSTGYVDWEWTNGQLSAAIVTGPFANIAYTGAQPIRLQIQLHAGVAYWSYALGGAALVQLTSMAVTNVDLTQIHLNIGADTDAMISANAGTVTYGPLDAHAP